ncbi:MAG: surface-adhesin E family protein [Synechococcus sp.]|nr:surface-adhesin E family protein [Synechococcus sp.]
MVASRSYDEDYGQYMEKELYVNPRTIRRNGPFVWWEVEAVNRDSNSQELMYHARAYYSGDCSRRVTRLREVSVFILDGESSDFQKNYGDQGEVNTVTPGSTGASLLDFVCRDPSIPTAATNSNR